MFQIDLKNRKSIYQQVVDNVKELIITGVLASDDKLPSVRELAGTLTINPNTVQKAYRELERQGYLYSVSGLGCFVNREAAAVRDPGALEEIREKLRETLSELMFLGYTKDEAKKLLDELLRERGDWK